MILELLVQNLLTIATTNFDINISKVDPNITIVADATQNNQQKESEKITPEEAQENEFLGVRKSSSGALQLTQYPLDLSQEILGKTPTGQEIILGGFSGLAWEKAEKDGKLHFITITDRGPNGESSDLDNDGVKERPFVFPDYQPRLIRFVLDRATGEIKITDRILLKKKDGTPITGLPNLQAGTTGSAYTDEEPVDLFGKALPNDPFGADPESLVAAPDGTFWLSDEYRPAIYHIDANGVLLDRFIPQGTAASVGKPEGTFGQETLPAIYAQRRRNRGFESLAFNPDNRQLYAFIQSPLDNPDVNNAEAETLGQKSDFNSRNSQIIRILEVDSKTGKATGEYIYYLTGFKGVDRTSDAVYAGNNQFYVIELDSHDNPTAKKFIFKVDLTEATNILGTELSMANKVGTSLESKSKDDLAAMNIKAASKTRVVNLPTLGYDQEDKIEGLTVLPDGSLAVINDNDFGLLDEELPGDGSVIPNPNPIPTVLGIIEFQKKLD